MLILFDQGTPIGIKQCLEGHTVRTAYELGWSTLVNGELIKAAEDAGFQILLTTDKNLPHQQNLSGRNIAVVILSNTKWSLIQQALPAVSEAINNARFGQFYLVEIAADSS